MAKSLVFYARLVTLWRTTPQGKLKPSAMEFALSQLTLIQITQRIQQATKQLEEKVESLKKVEAEYYKKLDLRRKQFSVVLVQCTTLYLVLHSLEEPICSYR